MGHGRGFGAVCTDEGGIRILYNAGIHEWVVWLHRMYRTVLFVDWSSLANTARLARAPPSACVEMSCRATSPHRFDILCAMGLLACIRYAPRALVVRPY